MSPRLRVSRTIELPDPLRVARCRRAPELGPRILFFSGGSALRDLSRTLKNFTHNSSHLITAFDSGGSSAALRRAFSMLSVGDLRNRLMALADETVRGNPEIYRLFSHRFPTGGDRAELGERLERMVLGTDPLVAEVPTPMRRIVRTHLRLFVQNMPRSFDLRGASIGNLVLAGGYLNNDGDIDSVVYLFSRLIEARGTVLPIVDADLHLGADLVSGARVIGQHLLTGKEAGPIDDPIRSLELVEDLEAGKPTTVAIHEKVRRLIGKAELVCFPMGSFYSSVVANLLPTGVGSAIVEVDCPKIYVPSTGHDPELLGKSIGNTVEELVAYVRRDAGEDTPVERILDYVLVDTASGAYGAPLELERAEALGVRVVDMPLVTEASRPNIDAPALTEILISLI